MGSYIDVDVASGRFKAYLARPEDVPAPAVVVVQEIFGVNADLRATCDELAEQGYLALSPDLFWRMEPGLDMTPRSPADWKKGFALYNAFEIDLGVSDILATMAAARALPGATGKVGLMGFCLGGLMTFLVTARHGTDASVEYYGGRTEEFLAEAKNIRSPLMLHLGAEDEYIGPAARAAIIFGPRGKRTGRGLRLSRAQSCVCPARRRALRRGSGGIGERPHCRLLREAPVVTARAQVGAVRPQLAPLRQGHPRAAAPRRRRASSTRRHGNAIWSVCAGWSGRHRAPGARRLRRRSPIRRIDMTKILVLFHSVTGHIERMATAEAEGARSVEDCEVALKRVPVSGYEEAVKVLGNGSRSEAAEAEPGELADYDAIIFGTPTRFGNMSGQMRNFLDQTSALWLRGALIGKVGSVFTSSATQHGGQESTILTFHPTLFHLGMVVVGLPYSETLQMGIDEIKGGSPYGASTIAGGQGEKTAERAGAGDGALTRAPRSVDCEETVG